MISFAKHPNYLSDHEVPTIINKLVFRIIVKDCFFLQKMNCQKLAKTKNCTQRYAAKACRICDRFVCLQHKE